MNTTGMNTTRMKDCPLLSRQQISRGLLTFNVDLLYKAEYKNLLLLWN